MEMIANVLMGAGALGAGLFCYVLARRLSAFGTLEGGMGGAIAVLSMQVDDMTKVLDAARKAASDSSRTLQTQTERAEQSAQRLELLLASLHDLPEADRGGAGRKPRVVHRGHRTRAVDTGISPGGFATSRPRDHTEEAA